MSELIHVAKDGERLAVHPTCLAAHERAGWSVVEAPKPKIAPKPAAASTEAVKAA